METLRTSLLICAVPLLGLTSMAYARPCPTGDLLQARQLESLMIAQNNATKVHRALDGVMNATGPGDPGFDAGISYLLSIQLGTGLGQMDIWIDTAHSTDADSFKTNWGKATQNLLYRKRTEDDWTLAEYQEDPATCLRKITAYSTGKNYNVTNNQILVNGQPTTPPTNSAYYSEDRFYVKLQEVDPSVGHDCNFNFRIVGIAQITEARFPLPPVPVPAANLANTPPTSPQFGVVNNPNSPSTLMDANGKIAPTAVLPLIPCS